MSGLTTLRNGLDGKRHKNALVHESKERGHPVGQLRRFAGHDDGRLIGGSVPDLIADEKAIADPKLADGFTDAAIAHLNGYLAITGLNLARLLNFKHFRLDS